MKTMFRVALSLLLAFAVHGADAQLAKGHGKISRDLAEANASGSLDVIVQYKHVPRPANYGRAASLHGVTKAQLHFIKAAAFNIPASALARLAADPDVKYISPDRPLQSFLSNAAPAVNAPYAWSFGYDGSGVGVAVVDSGISNHDDLKDAAGHNRILYQANFASDAGNADAYGHGTHIAGIIGGTGKDSTCSTCFAVMKGIAPNVTFVNLRALDKNGHGSDSSVINAINKAIQLKSTYNIRVLNLSLGRGVFESYTQDPLCQAVEAAWKAGIVVVVAAGNYGRDNSVGEQGYGTITAPGNDPYVITVGAMKSMGTPDRADDLVASCRVPFWEIG
jgi:serine protease AprX